MTLGERIRELREAQGITQAELAKKADVAKGTITQYELGLRKQPRLEQLQAIAVALGVSVSYLVGEPTKINIPMPDYPVRLPSEEEIGRMSPAEQEYYSLRLLADTAPDTLKKKLDNSYNKLNKLGQVEVVRRTQELAQLPRYTEADPRNTQED